jgi:hypothetical protein
VTNPSVKQLIYQVQLSGRDARDFSIPKGQYLTIGARATEPLSIEFKSRFLRPAEAYVVLVGSRQGINTGCSLVFKLKTQIDNVMPEVSP